MRIAVAEIKQEGNTFTPIEATLQDFQVEHILEGLCVVEELKNTNTEIWGFVHRASELGMTTVPLLAASALSGGVISHEAFSYLQNRLIQKLKAEYPVNGVFLALHGAMCANVEGGEDATGLLLRNAREVVGSKTPIIATLDLHANVTPQMAEMADALIGYRTWPHIDQAERGQEAAEMMEATLRGEVRPVTVLSKLRMILQVENGQTSTGPMVELLSWARKWEKEGSCLSSSIYLVQPWMDLPEMGCATVIVGDGDRIEAQSLADSLGKRMWDLRHEFDVPLISIDDAINRALASKHYPFVFADVADSTGSGTPGDSTAILQKLIERNVQCKVFLPIVDAEVVDISHQAGLRARINISIGAKNDCLNHKSVQLEVEVKWLGKDINFVFEGPVFTGLKCEMGDVAVIKYQEIYILVTKRPIWTYDPAMYRAVDLNPTEAKIVVVKSQNSFRAAYSGIAQDVLLIDAPGLSTSNIRGLNFNHIPRPIYPFDIDWPGAPWQIQNT
jgi:microcystin degradation protein MlrC